MRASSSRFPIADHSSRATRRSWSLALLFPLGLMGLVLTTSQRAQVVQAQRVELVDSSGTVLATVSAEPSGLRLALTSGEELVLTPDASLILSNRSGEEMIRLGGPMMRPTPTR